MRALLVCALCVITIPAHAQSLKLPTIAASAAASVDWLTTYQATTGYYIHETNPMLRRLSPGKMAATGLVLDAAAITTWNLTVGKRHPKLAAIGLWTLTAFRSYLVVRNIRNMQTAQER